MLGQETLGTKFGDYYIEDYIVMHLTHSKNTKLNILTADKTEYGIGLKKHIGKDLHEIWSSLLSKGHKKRFVGAYWDECFKKYKAPPELQDWYKYINERYI